MKRSGGHHRWLWVALLGLGIATEAWAARWTFKESITLSEAFTDNLRLVEEDPESRWATIVSPNMFLSGKGRRLEVELAAAWQFVSGADQNFFPILRANAHSELVKQRFFLDLNASAVTRTINPLKPAGTPVNDTGNLNTNYQIGINPYYLEHFGDFADLRLDYRYRRDFYTSGDLSDRTGHDFNFGLNSGRGFGFFSWRLWGRYSKTTYDDDDRSGTTFKSLNFEVGHQLLSTLSIYGSVGREWNTYNDRRSRRGGDSWFVRTHWQPYSRVSLDLGYGYRFFGYHPYVNLQYRHRRSAWTLRYDETLQSGYQPLDYQDVLATTDLLGNEIDPFDNLEEEARARESTYLYQNGAYVNRRFSTNYLFRGRRGNLRAFAYYSDKDYEGDVRQITEWSVGGDISRTLLGNLYSNLGVRWKNTQNESGLDVDTWYVRFSLTRQLGSHSHVRFNYTYSQRDSNQPLDDYTENRFALVLNTTVAGLMKRAGYR